MNEPSMAEVDDLYTSRTRSIERENKRQNEIRRLARNALMHSRVMTGTRDEILQRAINKATLVYDDVEQFSIPKKGEPL